MSNGNDDIIIICSGGTRGYFRLAVARWRVT
jgi:hypothetical protein